MGEKQYEYISNGYSSRATWSLHMIINRQPQKSTPTKDSCTGATIRGAIFLHMRFL